MNIPDIIYPHHHHVFRAAGIELTGGGIWIIFLQDECMIAATKTNRIHNDWVLTIFIFMIKILK